MINLTAKEQAAINHIARDNGCGATTKSYLKQDNMTWFSLKDLVSGMGLSRHEAAGIMSALNAKGLAYDYEAGATIRYDRADWVLTDAGIDASDLDD